MGKINRLQITIIALLFVVGLSAMIISYTALIDIAVINGISSFAYLFPVIVDLGTIISIISLTWLKKNSFKGKTIPWVMFIFLSVLSVTANANHALLTADLTITSVTFAYLISATPAIILTLATHVLLTVVSPKPKIINQKVEEETIKIVEESIVNIEEEKTETVTENSTPEPPPAVSHTLVVKKDTTKNEKITKKDRINWIENYCQNHGTPPEIVEIINKFGISKSTALRDLEKAA